jgi:hypothetical protein
VKKVNANEHAKRGHGASDWIEKTIMKKFEELPTPKLPTLREKALASAAVREESLTEVEILQKIIVRENLVFELQKLLQFQVDLDGVISEVDELIRAIRYQTLEVIEEIAAWKSDSKAPRQFFYRGQNYLLKLFHDTSFLDEYDDLGEHYGFYFTGNPLFYDGIVSQQQQQENFIHDTSRSESSSARKADSQRSSSSHPNPLPSQNTFTTQELDGIEVWRLHNAELTLQKETELFHLNDDGATAVIPVSERSGIGGEKNSSVLQIGEANFSVIENGTASTVMNNSTFIPASFSPNDQLNQMKQSSHHREVSEGSRKRSPNGTLRPVKVVNELK